MGEYTGSDKRTLFVCKRGHRFYSYPSYILKALLSGCKECRKLDNGYRPLKTHEQYLSELNCINSSLVPIEKYSGANKPIRHMCKIHRVVTSTIPSNALKGIGCSLCGKDKARQKFLKEKTDYIKQLSDANPNITLIGDYLGADTYTLFECSCGYSWIGRPQSYINPNACGCKKCTEKRLHDDRRMSLDEYKNRLCLLNNGIEVIDPYYINSQTKLKHRCSKCGCIWESIPNNILRGHGCPKCNLSFGEKRISEYLDKENIAYDAQKKFYDLTGIGGRYLSYDFYIYDLNLLIEYQGEQHEHPIEYFGGVKKFKTQKEHDKRKREYARNNNFNLIEIWYKDFERIDEILSNVIKSLKLESLETVIPPIVI